MGGQRLIARQMVRIDRQHALAGARQMNRERGARTAGAYDEGV
ncbi:hypothetical protein MYA_3683 [Burkholderia sp. KJ006]|nr:hypothetical protein MYA_3683 [Burkholderia sp. KJ006]